MNNRYSFINNYITIKIDILKTKMSTFFPIVESGIKQDKKNQNGQAFVRNVFSCMGPTSVWFLRCHFRFRDKTDDETLNPREIG